MVAAVAPAALSDCMAELKRLLRRLLPHIPRVLLCMGFLYFVPVLIESKIARGIPGHLYLHLWCCVIVFAITGFALRIRWENGFLGNGRKQPFKMEPGEALVFSTNFVGALLYRRAEAYSPTGPNWLLACQKRFLRDPYLILWLTNRRLLLRSWRTTWRVIPVPSIEWVKESPRRLFYSPDSVVIGYRHESRSEVLVIEDKSVIGRTLKEALHGLNLLSAQSVAATGKSR